MKDIKLKEIKKNFEIDRPLILLVDFKQYEHMFKLFYEPIIDKNDPRLYLEDDITIYDCLEIYSKQKRLKSQNDYICPKCNRSVTPKQTKMPYLSPKYLIISFNRIQKDFDDLLDLINNKKEEIPIGYPLEDLDLSPFFIGDNNCIYDLKVVILHIGDIKNAQYKTLIKKKNIWYEIDEQEIKQINKNKVINPDAYILIYEKKEDSIYLKNLGEIEENIDINISINQNNLKLFKKNIINDNKYKEEYDEVFVDYSEENNPLKKDKNKKGRIFGIMEDI